MEHNLEGGPLWVGYTPGDLTYSLTMFDQGGGSDQDIDLTRDEFIALKNHLAVIRGYAIEAEIVRDRLPLLTIQGYCLGDFGEFLQNAHQDAIQVICYAVSEGRRAQSAQEIAEWVRHFADEYSSEPEVGDAKPAE